MVLCCARVIRRVRASDGKADKMHSYFYRKKLFSESNRRMCWSAALLIGFAWVGSAVYRAFPAGDSWSCRWILEHRAPLPSAWFAACLPLLLCAGLSLLPRGANLCMAVPAGSGFLLGYCAEMFFLELGREAMAASCLYLLWRGLPALLPFLLIGGRGSSRRALVCGLTACVGIDLIGRILLYPFLRALLP